MVSQGVSRGIKLQFPVVVICLLIYLILAFLPALPHFPHAHLYLLERPPNKLPAQKFLSQGWILEVTVLCDLRGHIF